MKGFLGFLLFLVLMVVGVFVLIALASGGSVGDGIIGFFKALISGAVAVWNAGGS